MPFDVVKGKNCSISGWQLRDGFIQSDSINDWHRVWVFGALNDLNRRFAIFRRLLHAYAAFAEVHEHLIDRQTVQPGRKGRLASKTSDLSKELDENLLGEVFGFRNTPGHSETERVDATIVALVEILESAHVTLGRFL